MGKLSLMFYLYVALLCLVLICVNFDLQVTQSTAVQASATTPNVFSYSTKILSYNPLVYWRLNETSGVTTVNLGSLGSAANGTITSEAVTLNQPSLLKEESDAAARLSSGKIEKSGVLNATAGVSVSMLVKINAYPEPAPRIQEIAVLGEENNSPFHQVKLKKEGDYGGIFSFGVRTTATPSLEGVQCRGADGNLQLNRIYHLVATVNYTDRRIKCFVDGRLRGEGTTVGSIRPLLNSRVRLNSTDGSVVTDVTLDEFAVFDHALTDSEARNLFLSARAVDENITTAYVAPNGNYFAKGTIDDPLDIYTSGSTGLLPPGGTIFLGGGTYNLNNSWLINLKGTSESRIKIQNSPGEHAVLNAAPGYSPVVFADINSGVNPLEKSEYVDFIGQTYAYSDGIKGIEIRNISPRRIAPVSSSGPDGTAITTGTINGNTFTTTNPNILFTADAEGLPFELYNGSTLAFATVIQSATSRNSATFVDSYSGIQALEGNWKAYIRGQAGSRSTGINVYGRNIRIINPIIHDCSNGLGMWEESTNSELYGGLIFNNGYLAADRSHGHGHYTQNNNTTQSSYKKLREYITFNNFALNGKAWGDSGYTDNLTFDGTAAWNGGLPGAIFDIDIFSVKRGTGNTVTGSRQINYVPTTDGGLVPQDWIRLAGAGLGGRDLYTRVLSISGNSATLLHPAQTTVSNSAIVARPFGGNTGSNLLVGSATKPSNNINVTNSYAYTPDDGRLGGGFGFGYESLYNQNFYVAANYIVGNAPLTIKRWREGISTKNTLVHYHSNTSASSNFAFEIQGEKAVIWQANTQYGRYAVIKPNPSNGFYYVTYQGGVSGTTQPAFPTMQGSYVTDGGVQWLNVGNKDPAQPAGIYIDENTYHAVNVPNCSGNCIAFFSPGVTNSQGTSSKRWFDPANPGRDWLGTGWDSEGNYFETKPTLTRIFVRPQDPNIGQRGRANIFIYNWQFLNTVTVNLSNIGLQNGQRFQVRDAEDFMNTVVFDGICNSATPTVQIPMTGNQIAQPIGWRLTPLQSTKPEFGAFVVLPYN